MKTEEEIKSIRTACEAILNDDRNGVSYFNIPEEEDYSVKDATLWFPGWLRVPLEVKRYGGNLLNADGTLDGHYVYTTSGIMRDKIYVWNNLEQEWAQTVPGNLKGHCVFAINDDKKTNTKWKKLMAAEAWFAINAEDCIIYYSNAQLKNAYLGDAYLYCNHTTDIKGRSNGGKHMERKAFIDLEKGNIIKKYDTTAPFI